MGEKKKSVVLQCAVQGTQDIDVQWFKEGQQISAKTGGRYSIEKKKSEAEMERPLSNSKLKTQRSLIKEAINWWLGVRPERLSLRLSLSKRSKSRWRQQKELLMLLTQSLPRKTQLSRRRKKRL